MCYILCVLTCLFLEFSSRKWKEKKNLPFKVDEVSDVPSKWKISNKCQSVAAAAAAEMKADSQVLRLHPSQSPSLPSVSHSLGSMYAAHLQPVEALELLSKMSLCDRKSKMELVLLRKGKWKSVSWVQLFATPWTMQKSMEFSRPEY